LKIFTRNFQVKCTLVATAVSQLYVAQLFAVSYPVIDTGQSETYNATRPIEFPEAGAPFYGQDAQYNDQQIQAAYQDNEDGTITDLNTGLMWVQARGVKMTWADAYTGAADSRVGDYEDWRMPSIKDLFSLIDFRGYIDPEGDGSIPFIDNDYFEFVYGDEDAGERIIDSQDWTATEYVHFTMGNDSTVFGVNFADGRIKGYPKYIRREQNVSPNELFIRYVRGNADYGSNNFVDNDDNTITDEATGLMWSKADSEEGLNWESALSWVESMNDDEHLSFHDWRLPNAKELQSIIDYSRAPAVTNSAAIDPLFTCTEIENEGGEADYPQYWSNTTHLDGPENRRYQNAAYVCFGRGLGWMEPPPNFEWTLLDVHGAGAQRSDPKVGDPEDYPHGNGPQGDVIRIYNYVRLVRGQGEPFSVKEERGALPTKMQLFQNFPNPFNSTTTIRFSISSIDQVSIVAYNSRGRLVEDLFHGIALAGINEISWNTNNYPTGFYFLHFRVADYQNTIKTSLIR